MFGDNPIEFSTDTRETTDKSHDKWIIIESMSSPISATNNSVPTEHIALNYEKVEWTYATGDGDFFA